MGNFKPKGQGGFRNRDSGRSGGFRDRDSERPRGGFRDRDSGRSGGFGNRSRGNSFSRGPAEMHDVTCDKCGKECQVPFKPSGNKPVLCSDCFRKNDNSGNNFSSRERSKSTQPVISSGELNKINAKLDKILQVLKDLEMYDDEDEEIEMTKNLEEDEE